MTFFNRSRSNRFATRLDAQGGNQKELLTLPCVLGECRSGGGDNKSTKSPAMVEIDMLQSAEWDGTEESSCKTQTVDDEQKDRGDGSNARMGSQRAQEQKEQFKRDRPTPLEALLDLELDVCNLPPLEDNQFAMIHEQCNDTFGTMGCALSLELLALQSPHGEHQQWDDADTAATTNALLATKESLRESPVMPLHPKLNETVSAGVPDLTSPSQHIAPFQPSPCRSAGGGEYDLASPVALPDTPTTSHHTNVARWESAPDLRCDDADDDDDGVFWGRHRVAFTDHAETFTQRLETRSSHFDSESTRISISTTRLCIRALTTPSSSGASSSAAATPCCIGAQAEGGAWWRLLATLKESKQRVRPTSARRWQEESRSSRRFPRRSVHIQGEMNRIFGKKKAEVPQVNISDVGGRVDGRVGDLDMKMAKTKGPGLNAIKQRAMQTLKRKKMYEQQRDNLTAQSFNIEQAAFAIETSKDTLDTVAAMKSAVVQLKTETKKINIDELEDVQDDMADLLEDMNEIQEIMGRSYGIGADVDESELEAELAGLEEEWAEEETEAAAAEAAPSYLAPAQQHNLPAAPSGVLDGARNGRRTDEFGLPIAS
ncbi:Charged multivesicular body protein 5, partial [Globisporangium splendens]